MPDDPKTLGHRGEAAALAYLKSQGFTVLETNWRIRSAEVDIIAKDGHTICFIEVKTRRNFKKGLPREAITLSKQRKIIRAALYYCQKKKLVDQAMRFDVVEVIANSDTLSVNLIKHAFQGD